MQILIFILIIFILYLFFHTDSPSPPPREPDIGYVIRDREEEQPYKQKLNVKKYLLNEMKSSFAEIGIGNESILDNCYGEENCYELKLSDLASVSGAENVREYASRGIEEVSEDEKTNIDRDVQKMKEKVNEFYEVIDFCYQRAVDEGLRLNHMEQLDYLIRCGEERLANDRERNIYRTITCLKLGTCKAALRYD